MLTIEWYLDSVKRKTQQIKLKLLCAVTYVKKIQPDITQVGLLFSSKIISSTFVHVH